MPRPKRARNIEFEPDVTYFKPRGIPMRSLKETDISLDELESIRLKYMEGKNNEEAAEAMKISSSTFQRLVTTALQKITVSLIKGNAIKLHKNIF